MKKLLTYASILLLSFVLKQGNVFASSNKIGIIDMQRALVEVEPGKKAKAELEREFNQLKETLSREEAEIKKMHEDFMKQSALLSPEGRTKKQTEIQGRIMKFQEKTTNSQQDLNKKLKELSDPIL